MPTKVRVAVRIRPMLAWERTAGHTDTRVTNAPDRAEVVYHSFKISLDFKRTPRANAATASIRSSLPLIVRPKYSTDCKSLA